ncbi:hypothetical protein Tco_1487029, partial [Tanacetum coccineum]
PSTNACSGSYAQWPSRIMRYIDLKPNGKLIKQCIFDGPYELKQVPISDTPAEGDNATQEQRFVKETYETATQRKYLMQKQKQPASYSME